MRRQWIDDWRPPSLSFARNPRNMRRSDLTKVDPFHDSCDSVIIPKDILTLSNLHELGKLLMKM